MNRFSDYSAPLSQLAAAGKTAAMVRRYANAGACFDSARLALRDFERGTHLFGLTKGQFSMIDLAAAVLEKTGPARVSVWTWCIAEYDVQAFGAFILNGAVNDLRVVLDWSGAQRSMQLIEDLQRQYGLDCIRVTKTHAKIVAISTDDGWRVVIRGSMNLNSNPRFEQFDISDAPDIFGVVDGMMAELWATGLPLAVRRLNHDDAIDLLKVSGSVVVPAWANNMKSWWNNDSRPQTETD